MKVNVEVSRSLTLNVGDYESIKPQVTITATDVDADKAADAYLCIEEALTGLMQMEVMNCFAAKKKWGEHGGHKFCSDVVQNQEKIGTGVESALAKLNTL